MTDRLSAFLSRPYSGLVIAALVAALASVQWNVGRPLPGLLLGCGALVLAAGATARWIRLTSIRRRFPAPGKLVDIGGYRIHLLVEGDRGDKATVVWLPGSHGGGSHLHHLHDLLRTTTRSILIDRPGSGWSDVGPFPRTTQRETQEIIKALESAGERPPFVFAGHSFGGLLAANIARARPDLVSCLVLIDATPPETIVFGPRHPALRQMRREAWRDALLSVFGIHQDRMRRVLRESPQHKDLFDLIAQRLGPHLTALNAVESDAGTALANASIFRELSPEGMARAGWDIAVYDGDLGDMPVLLVAPGDMVELQDSLQQLDARGAAAQRVQRFYARSRERYLAVSRNSRRIYAPPGTGHNFPTEAPEFLAGVMREAIEIPPRPHPGA
jgi:pimeloyl-ACP methyl ester carboxylesterase